jgi:hypothetical protein
VVPAREVLLLVGRRRDPDQRAPKRPRASIAYFEGEKCLVNAHGHAELMYRGHPAVGEIDAIFREHYGGSAFDWSEDGVYLRLDADRFFTHSRTPKAFPS